MFTFPHPVNEHAARLVAGLVAILTLSIIMFDLNWLMYLLAYGFLARVLTGPTLSPIGLFVTRVLIPMLGNPSKPVAGPPKKFAQSVGLVFSVTAILLHYILGLPQFATITLSILTLFALLESILGFCAGCFVFGNMMRLGLIPQEICERCNNLVTQKRDSPV